jgi:2'-5' RNA ligase
LRVFVAIDLEPELKKALQDLVMRLKKTGADVRWVNFSGMHLTLKFVGEIAEGDLPAVQTVLRDLTRECAGFPLALRGTGTFPESRSPRVLWVGVKEEPGLMALAEEIEKRLAAEGFPPENRPFHPHLTLGRVKSASGIQATLRELEKYREAPLGEMAARKVTLFESVLKPEGAEYRVVSEFELR